MEKYPSMVFVWMLPRHTHDAMGHYVMALMFRQVMIDAGFIGHDGGSCLIVLAGSASTWRHDGRNMERTGSAITLTKVESFPCEHNHRSFALLALLPHRFHNLNG